MEYSDSKVLNSAMKKKNKAKLKNYSFSQPKVVRILEPIDSNKESKWDSQQINKNLISQKKTWTFAQNPYELLKGISDMFVKADLSWNFAKKSQKVGWSELSNSILNKLHPSNAIFMQQIDRLKKEKENYQLDQQRLDNKRKRRKRNSINHSLKRVPSTYSGNSGSWKQSVINEVKTELEKELLRINEREHMSSILLKQITANNKAASRPIGGRNYKHIKSRFKDIVSKTKHGALSNAFIERRENKRLRPSSAWSSPTKIGNGYDKIENSDSDYEESKKSSFRIIVMLWQNYFLYSDKIFSNKRKKFILLNRGLLSIISAWMFVLMNKIVFWEG